jgi:formate hydrogenlyase subunit 3/multisubunit Na+/H+ antiporter MnhD subunit
MIFQYKQRRRSETVWRLFLLAGVACLIIVGLTHIAETFRIFPSMGWGLRNSAGHYLDLVSAIFGFTFLVLGFSVIIFSRRHN